MTADAPKPPSCPAEYASSPAPGPATRKEGKYLVYKTGNHVHSLLQNQVVLRSWEPDNSRSSLVHLNGLASPMVWHLSIRGVAFWNPESIAIWNSRSHVVRVSLNLLVCWDTSNREI